MSVYLRQVFLTTGISLTPQVVQSQYIPDTVVEGFGVKLRILFCCPIFISTFMFIFIYLFPYFGGDWAALVPAMVVVGLCVSMLCV